MNGLVERSCEDAPAVRELLRLREEDRLERDGARRLRAHLAACASCRTAALRDDPTLLFARLAEEDPEACDVEALVDGVVGEAALARTRRRFAAAGRRRIVAGLAATVVLGASLAGLWVWRVRSGEASAPAAVAAVPALSPDPVPAARRSVPPAVEGFEAPGAQVYQFAASTRGEPTVVFVVDRNADI